MDTRLGSSGSTSGFGAVVSGFRFPLEGLSLLLRERSLWVVAAVPLALSLLAVGITLALLAENAAALWELVSSWMPVLEARAWYSWLWVAPAMGVFHLMGALLFIASSVAFLVAAMLIANVVAAPFLDALSQRVERIECGELLESGAGGLAAALRDTGRSVSNELQRLAFFLAIGLTLGFFGVIVPGAQLLVAPAMLVFSALFLPLEYSGHVLDRRGVPFRVRRAWVLSQLPRMMGFGTAGLLTCLVPGLNFLLLPVLVAGGTLLAVRYPPDAAIPS